MMHDIHANTVADLPAVISAFQAFYPNYSFWAASEIKKERLGKWRSRGQPVGAGPATILSRIEQAKPNSPKKFELAARSLIPTRSRHQHQPKPGEQSRSGFGDRRQRRRRQKITCIYCQVLRLTEGGTCQCIQCHLVNCYRKKGGVYYGCHALHREIDWYSSRSRVDTKRISRRPRTLNVQTACKGLVGAADLQGWGKWPKANIAV